MEVLATFHCVHFMVILLLLQNFVRDADSNSRWSGSVVAKWKADEMVKTGQKIERFSGILFPVVLALFVLCYFLVYLT